jgi:Fe-S-cluster containining protein
MACLCDQCAALCCRYFALPIDNPDCKRDYDNIRWYLLHQNVVVFVESKQWYIGVLNRCRQLQDDNRCGIYLTRPAICRSYTTENCDYHAGDYGYDQLFTSAEALWEYALKTLADERKSKLAKAKSKLKSRTRPKLKRPPSLATRARQLSETRPLPANVLEAPAPRINGNGRSIALPLLQR